MNKLVQGVKAALAEAELLRTIFWNYSIIQSPKANSSVPSRVLKDAFHLMDMLSLSKRYGVYKEFFHRFKEALLVTIRLNFF